MNRHHWLLLALLGSLLLAAAGVAVAQGQLDLRRARVAGGGGSASGQRFAARLTLGQAEAGRVEGTRFAASLGFLPAVGQTPTTGPSPTPTATEGPPTALRVNRVEADNSTSDIAWLPLLGLLALGMAAYWHRRRT